MEWKLFDGDQSEYASKDWYEDRADTNHYEYHLWAWDPDGYKKLFENNGYDVVEQHLVSGWSQVLLCVKN